MENIEMARVKEMLQQVSNKKVALSDDQMGQAVGGQSYLERCAEVLSQYPDPSQVSAYMRLFNAAYNSAIAYQNRTGIIMSDEEAEKYVWDYMSGRITD